VLLGVRERIEALQRRYPRHLSAGGEDALVVGKGMGEDATNGAAARPVVPAREGRARKESLGEKWGRNRDEPEAALGSEGGSAVDEPSSSEPATSVWTLEFGVDLSLHSAVPTGNSSI